MTAFKYVTLIILSLAFSIGWAGGEPPRKEKPSIQSSQTMKVNALVEAVDYETREVTLRDSSGELINFVAGDELKNLAQMKAGDIVIAEYTESLYIDVFDDQGSVPSESDFTVMGTAEEGQKPGLSAFDSYVVTATVEDINLENNTFKLKWPDESVEEFIAQNPKNLRQAEVGDLVVITRTVTMDISVEETD